MTMIESRIHAVRFYQDAASLCHIAGDFVADGLLSDRPAIVIATPEHRQGLEERLVQRGVEVAASTTCGDLVMLDAEDTLARFMQDGMPDPASFVKTIGPVIEATRGATRRIPCAYGEMVDVLWKTGHTRAASRLERLWNNLSRTLPFSLLCGYAIGSVYHGGDVDEICSHHSHVLSEGGEVTALA